MGTVNKDSRVEHARKLKAGVLQHLAGEPQIVLDGKATTPTEIETVCDTFVQAVGAATAARAAWKELVAAQKAAASAYRVLEVAMHKFLVLKYGATSKILADFGWEPKQRQPLPVAEKAAAADKTRATRKARGTKGSKQRKAIHGDPAAPPAADGATPPDNAGGKPRS